MRPLTVDTPLGAVAYHDVGKGPVVLFVHGSPGDHDQGVLDTAFLVRAGIRVLCPSRPGYEGTPLTDANRTPEAQADLHAALLDAAEVDRCGVLCWSGGGPSSYLLADRHPGRVSALVTLAAVSGPYTFGSGLDERILETWMGHVIIAGLAAVAPKTLLGATLGSEGDLSRSELKALVKHVSADPTKRQFVLDLARNVTGHKAGLDNDRVQFPGLDDLGLATITAPTLLVHGSADSDVAPEYSERAVDAIAGAELHAVKGGTHLATWTDPTSAGIQRRIIDHLRGGAGS